MWDIHGPGFRMHEGYAAGWAWMAVMMVLVAVLVAVLTALALKHAGPALRPPLRPTAARQLLRRRLAAGDIGEDEFQRLTATLDSDRGRR